jgi:hypothetical protein
MDVGLYKHPMKNILRTAKFLTTWGFYQRYFKSIKGSGNTFDLIHNWSRTLPSLIYFSWDINRDPPSMKKNQFFFMEGGLYKYPMENILRTAKFLTTWGINQRYYPGL